MTFPEKVALEAAFAEVHDLWSPRVVARVNDQFVKVAKVKGELAWHSHADEDELFFIFRGHLSIEYEGGRSVDLPEGSLHVVSRGVLHNPVAKDECWIVLVETMTTRHTGDVQTPLTRSLEEQMGHKV